MMLVSPSLRFRLRWLGFLAWGLLLLTALHSAVAAEIGQGSKVVQGNPPRVVATTGFLADIATQIAGPSALVVSLLPQGSDPHRYDAVPNDTKRLAEADLIIQNGLNLEGWLDKLIAQAASKAQKVTASDGIAALSDPQHPGSYDPHAWMDPVLGRVYARNIYHALLTLCPDDSVNLTRRWSDYDQRLVALHEECNALLRTVPDKFRVLATNHDAFRYFAARYRFRVVSLLGTSTDADVRTSDVLHMKQVVLQNDLPCVFVEANLNPKMLQQIAQDAGCRLGPALFADSMGPPGSGADSYTGMLSSNARVLASSLGGEGAPSRTSDHSAPVSVLWVLGLMLPAGAFLAWSLRPSRSANAISTGPNEDKPGPRLRVQDLSVTYDRKSVLNAFSAEFHEGLCYGILGPNGAGKSTLFKAILGLNEPDHGNIEYRQEPVRVSPRRIAYVPQKGMVDWDFPATVQDIVQMGRLPWRGPGRPLGRADLRSVHEALEALELVDLRHRPLNQLSGGQQQRVFLARALAQEAETLLLDEPFVGVDAATEAKIVEILHRFTREQGGLVLMIHHDLQRANTYFDEVLLINQRLIAQGRPEEILVESNLLKAFSGVDPGYADAAQYRNKR
jgi:ABC-type Mn2+/Zn2+ transport system ATPase subunit/ABC-type Zn uptake system ZnuABC Zn-binding protein ZnuA